ncbi:ABC transporter ATP-binding protein [Reichenbachiella versicolor]|uniref:ABC transporter ATP-binding protein n=1 Tax=Reichenbachiella versicolor TaxID=1821036 RepID=UPI000D6EAE8A|nr:ATP-binding cassette domain-containing protein [Reichenbachiella versicolor]
MSILQIQNVSKRYDDHIALNDISFEIPEHAVLGLLGPNGAGKTTLIRIITQIILADQGTVIFKGQPMTHEDVRRIGYLPEERGLYKKMKVAEHLLYLVRLKGLSKSEAIKKINYWLDKMDMRTWINKRVEDLSKGMQQKVQFVATVAHEPDLLILDEPFSGFDPVNADLIKDELQEIKEKGTTIVYSTHRMEAVEELCDHIVLINKSSLVLNGAKKNIKDEHRDRSYLIDYLSGEINSSPDCFDLISTAKLEEGYQAHVRLKNGYTTTDLLKSVTDLEITSFNEKIPSIHDIFVQTVKSSSHE